jgi:LysM repeat protein
MSPPRRPSASRPAGRPPQRWTRYAAPAAFLLAATIAVLLVRSGLRGAETPAPTQPVTTVSKQKPKAKPATTRKTGTSTTRSGAARYYTVVAGDTFGTIASKNGTTVASIEALNPGIRSTSLFIGQRIRVG